MRRRLLPVLLATALGAALLAAPAQAAPPTDGPVPPSGAESATVEAGTEAVLTGATQVATGYYHSCAILVNRQLRCWGWNGDGGLGNDSPTDQFNTAVVVQNVAGTGPLQNVIQVVAGDYHTCALISNGQVRCWGDGDYGQNGNGVFADRLRPVVVRNATNTGPLQNVTQISAEPYGACALLVNDEVRCWGENDYGQLGNDNTPTNSALPVAVHGLGGVGRLTGVASLGGGFDNNCAVLNNGQARCWGYNGGGSGPTILGNGSNVDTAHPVVVKNLAGGGPLTGVTQISHGGHHGCVRLANGQARCWGVNDEGELGDGTLTDRDLPVAVKRAGGGALTGVVRIYAASNNTCAQVVGGQVRCWGDDTYAQLGDGTIEMPTVRKLPAPVRNGGNNGNLTGVTQMDDQSYHSCARRSNGEVVCWGFGADGELGNGADVNEPLPVKVLI